MQDGFNDLAVGAPYDEDGGAVYIYLGSKDGLKPQAVQVIKGSEVSVSRRIPKLKTFGYSLSGGLDIDQNGYPDLLVGAYESDVIVLLRTRPIIDIVTYVKGKLKNIDPTETTCAEAPGVKQACFAFEACFRLNSTSLSSHGLIKLVYRIEAETFTGNRKYYRVKFRDAVDTDTPNVIQRDMVVHEKGEDIRKMDFCSPELVFLKDKSDIQTPIKFKMTYALVQKQPELPGEGESMPDINRFPILNQEEAHKIFEARFLKDCGECFTSSCVVNTQSDNLVPHLSERCLSSLMTCLTDNLSSHTQSFYALPCFTFSVTDPSSYHSLFPKNRFQRCL